MREINQEEYEVLRNYFLRGIRWISRNKNGNLVVSKIKPDKFERKWLPQCPDEDWSELRNSEIYLFLFIQWEDSEPYNIVELIEEYENSYKGSWEHAIEFSKKMREESEETAELNGLDELEKVVAEKNKREAKNVDDAIQPDHYRKGEYEAIDVIKDVTMDYSGYEGYLIGNIIKYLYRANYKGNKLEDLKKGQYYYNELIESLEERLDE